MFKLQMTPQELNEFLKKHELTDVSFAKIISVTVPAIHHWQTGRRRIPDTVAKMIKCFDKYPGLLYEFTTFEDKPVEEQT